MQGREFLELARELLALGTDPRHWRAVMIHAYYGLLLECREAMTRWGLPPLTRQQVHAQVRLRLIYANYPDLKEIGRKLEDLRNGRNAANYDLRPLPRFATANAAQDAVTKGNSALALLDALDADPALTRLMAECLRP
jgi:hypothetical protein